MGISCRFRGSFHRSGSGGQRAQATFTREDTPAKRAQQLEALHAHLVSVQMTQPAWASAVQVAFVVATLGRLAAAADPIMRADAAAHGPVPRFHVALLEHLGQHGPDLPPRPEHDEPLDPTQDTRWALEDLAHDAAGAAVLMHPGGAIGVPTGS